MKLKRLTALMLTAVLALSSFAGCGSGSSSSKPAKSDGGETQAAGASGTLVIDVYDAAANYQGTQTGWFAKVVKDKFDIELNIISPQVAGQAIYQTRCSTGNLGDIILLDSIDFTDCVQAGLIKDISDKFGECTNLKEYSDQIDTYNKSLPNSAGKTYGIPTEMTNTSPTSYSQDVIYSSPLLRWDYYKELGSPDIENLDGLLDVLGQMKEKHPTNESGDPCYPLSLWSDWDGNDGMLGIANVVQLTTWYGEKIKDSLILKPDDTFTTVTDKSASYYKILQFLNHAYLQGLVDPDSSTQDWNSACAKMSAGQVYMFWYSWQVGFWNSQERLENGSAMIFIPVKDQLYYADSDTYYGSGRVFGVGSKVEGEKYDRIMKFLDWYASPEGLTYQHAGIKDFNYTVGTDGKYTQINDNALMDNLPVPAEYGGAGYQDGNNAINQWIVSANAINPVTNETYVFNYWSSYKEATMTDMKREWAERFGAPEPVDYMKANNVLLVSPNVCVNLPSDTNDIALKREQCNKELCESSWRMIFAKDDAEFEKMWDEMTLTMEGLGFSELVEFDTAKHQIELDAKIAAKK